MPEELALTPDRLALLAAEAGLADASLVVGEAGNRAGLDGVGCGSADVSGQHDQGPISGSLPTGHRSRGALPPTAGSKCRLQI